MVYAYLANALILVFITDYSLFESKLRESIVESEITVILVIALCIGYVFYKKLNPGDVENAK